jgi:hypothetical protein
VSDVLDSKAFSHNVHWNFFASGVRFLRLSAWTLALPASVVVLALTSAAMSAIWDVVTSAMAPIVFILSLSLPKTVILKILVLVLAPIEDRAASSSLTLL